MSELNGMKGDCRQSRHSGDGKTTKVIYKFAFCLLTDRGRCKILLSYFAIYAEWLVGRGEEFGWPLASQVCCVQQACLICNNYA